MQHKGLFAAVLCGALCLTGCLKNIESESVTEVRKAHAQQLISQAKLNEAQAQAEVIKANAEATIAAAQAQLLEAQAAIAEAEALRITVQAELEAVNVEIAKVKLEEEKVKLQAEKARLEQLLAEVDAAIAKADLAKQEALNKLEKAKLQAQIDKLEMQKKLVAAQENLLKETQKMDEETAKAIRKAYWNYSQALDKYYDAMAQKIEKEADVAKLEYDMTYAYYMDLAYISFYMEEIEELEEQIEFMQSFMTVSYEELVQMFADIQPVYYAATTALQVAQENVLAANTTYAGLIALQNSTAGSDKLEYTYNWSAGFINYLENEGITFAMEIDKDTYQYTQGILIPQEGALPVFTPLFTGFEHPFYGWTVGGGYLISDPDTYELYPTIENGVRSAYAQSFPTQLEFVPANIFTDNITAVVDGIVAVKAVAAAAAQVTLDEKYEAAKSGYLDEENNTHVDGVEDEIAAYQAAVDGMQVYVNAAEEAIEPLEKNVEAAQEALDKALVAKKEADNKITEYDKANMDRVAFNLADANWDEARVALDKANTALLTAKNSVVAKRLGIIGYGEEGVDGYVEGQKTKAAKAVAAKEAKEAEVEALEAKITDKIKSDYKTASANYETLVNETIPGLIDAEREAYDAWQAKVKAQATYGDAVTDTEVATAKKAHDDALEELNKAIADSNPGTDPDKPTTYDIWVLANDAFVTVYNPYSTAYVALNGMGPEDEGPAYSWGLAQEAEYQVAILEEAENELAELEEKLGTEATETAAATGLYKAVEDAQKALKEAWEARNAAFAPVAPMADDPAELKALKEEQVKAQKDVEDKIEELNKARNEYNKVLKAYNKYGFYKDELDPEYAPEATHNHNAADMWGWKKHDYRKRPSTAQRLADAQEHLLYIEKGYMDQTQVIADDLAEAQKEAETVKSNLKNYDAYKADYEAWGVQLVEASNAEITASKAVIDARIAESEVEAQYMAIQMLANGTVFVAGYDEEDNPITYNIEELEDYIYYLQTGKKYVEELGIYVKDPTFISIADYEARIEALEQQIESGKYSDEVNNKVLNNLYAELEALEKKIEVYAALIEMYSNQISTLTGNAPEVE